MNAESTTVGGQAAADEPAPRLSVGGGIFAVEPGMYGLFASALYPHGPAEIWRFEEVDGELEGRVVAIVDSVETAVKLLPKSYQWVYGHSLGDSFWKKVG